MDVDDQPPTVAQAAADATQEPPVEEETVPSPKPDNSTTVDPDPEPPGQEAQEPQEPPDLPKPKLCGVCETEACKYKCPRPGCSLPYCSVTCFRTHKENHPPEPPAPDPPKSVISKDSRDAAFKRRNAHPFSVLDDSPELRQLFKKYPFLPGKLTRIHATTLPPRDYQQQNHVGFPWKVEQGPDSQPRTKKWTHDTGLKRGKEALRKARTDPSEVGDAVREYCELVLHLLSRTKERDVIEMVRKEVTVEDAKLIEELIEAESQ